MLTWAEVGVVIRAVPGRRGALLARLRGRLDSEGIEHAVSWHAPGRTVPGSYADAVAAGAAWGRPWLLQFEDDALPCRGFADAAIRVLSAAAALPRVGLASLYSGRRHPAGAPPPPLPGYEVLPASRWFGMAQAVAIRSADAAGHNEFMIGWTSGRPLATDVATAAWLRSRGLRVVRAWPSLVQHDDGGDSLYGHRPHPNRTAPSFREEARS